MSDLILSEFGVSETYSETVSSGMFIMYLVSTFLIDSNATDTVCSPLYWRPVSVSTPSTWTMIGTGTASLPVTSPKNLQAVTPQLRPELIVILDKSCVLEVFQWLEDEKLHCNCMKSRAFDII